MFKKIAFCIAIGSQLMALSCSDPVTLSPPNPGQVTHFNLSTNATGDLVACWLQDDFERRIQVAIKPHGDDWFPYETIIQDINLSHVECLIDNQGTVNLYWKNGCCRTSKKQYAQKTWGGPWSKIEELEIMKGSIRNANNYAPYQFGDHLSLFEWSKGSDHVLFLGIISQQRKDNLYRQLSKALSFHGASYNYDPTGNVCVVWGQYAETGWFSSEEKNTLEAAWMKEGSSPIQRETICTFPESKTLRDLNLAVDTNGNVVVVWHIYKDGKETIESVNKSEGRWSTLTTVSPLLDHISHLQLACDDKGNALALWKAKRANRIFLCSAYKPYGKAWSTIHDISFLSRDQPVLLKADYAGNFIVIWNELEELKTLPMYGAVFSTQEEKWTSPIKISPTGQNYIASDVVFCKQGKGYIGWINANNLEKAVAQVAELTLETLLK